MGHGNWKDLFLASGRGDVVTMQYHLDQKIDPSFQHPEFFTAPIFEAIRKKQESAIRLLVDHDCSQLTLVEEMSGFTPLQCALKERKHDMVDVLLSFPDLPGTERQLIQSILILGDPTNPLETNVIEGLLENGLRLFLCPSTVDHELESFIQVLTNKTGNKKLTALSIQEDNAERWDSMDFVLVFDDISENGSLVQKVSKQSKADLVWVTPMRQMEAHQTLEKLGLDNLDLSLFEKPSHSSRLVLFDPILHFVGMTTWTDSLAQRIVKRFGCEEKDNTLWF